VCVRAGVHVRNLALCNPIARKRERDHHEEQGFWNVTSLTTGFSVMPCVFGCHLPCGFPVGWSLAPPLFWDVCFFFCVCMCMCICVYVCVYMCVRVSLTGVFGTLHCTPSYHVQLTGRGGFEGSLNRQIGSRSPQLTRFGLE
jgi:hypothetical protein